MSDMYVPRFQNKDSDRKFGFVRFLMWNNANKAICELDGKVWIGRSLEASFAKHNKRSRLVDNGRRVPRLKEKVTDGRKEPRSRVTSGVGVFSVSTNSKQPIRGETNPKMVEWLQRNLVCTETRDIGREKIEMLLKRDIPLVTKISSLGASSFLVMLDSFEHLK